MKKIILSVTRLWKKGLRLGYQEDLASLDKNRVTSVNALALIMFFIASAFTMGLFFTGMANWYYVLPALPIYTASLLANKRYRFILAQYILFFGSMCLVIFWCFTNRRVGAEYCLIALACSAPMTFKQKSMVYKSFFLSALAFFGYKIFDGVLPFTPDATVNYMALSALIIFASGAVVFFQLILFRELTHHYAGVLKNSNTEISKALEDRKIIQEELKNKNEELQSLSEQLNWIVKQKTSELQTYLDAINVNIYSSINDVSGNFVKVNDPLTSATGYAPEELIGKNLRLLDSGYHPDAFYNEMEQAMLAGKTWRGEVKNRGREGSFYWTDQVIIPIKSREGTINYFLMLGLPITERKANEESREKTIRLLEAIAFRTSHKIRGPLARIQGLINLVQRDLIEPKEYKIISTKLEDCSTELNLATTDLVEFVNDHQNSIQYEPSIL
jgi:PAS domain S-box-containing protein